MAYVIDREGNKYQIDAETKFGISKCAILSDDMTLWKVFLLNLYQCDTDHVNEPELIKQIRFLDEPPTKEQMIYRMSEAGLSRYDIVTIEEGYMLDFDDFFGSEKCEHFPIKE